MSKTVEGSYIGLGDSLEMIRKRLSKAPTDSGEVGGEVPETGGVANLFKLLKLFGDEDMVNKFVQDYREKKIRYGELKGVLADVIYKEIEPIQERRREYEENPVMVDRIVEEHTERCQELADVTMREVKGKMGLL